MGKPLEQAFPLVRLGQKRQVATDVKRLLFGGSLQDGTPRPFPELQVCVNGKLLNKKKENKEQERKKNC